MNSIQPKPKTVHLADDDDDDCMLFEEALRELKTATVLLISNDGAGLLKILDDTVPPPPYVIFLDLNMPRKNGFEALREIRQSAKLKGIPVIIFSTSSDEVTIDLTFELGAHYFISKPPSFLLLVKALEKVFTLELNQFNPQPARNQFVLAS